MLFKHYVKQSFLLLLAGLYITVIKGQWPTTPDAEIDLGYGHNTRLIPDSNGGVIIYWDTQDTYSRVYAQRVDKYGYTRWDNPVDVGGTETFRAMRLGGLANDDNGGAYLTFNDVHYDSIGYPAPFQDQVRIQHLDSMGNKLWGDGIVLTIPESSHPGNSVHMQSDVVPDGNGGAIVGWIDFRISTIDYAVYVQRLSPQGARLWDSTGVLVSNRVGSIGLDLIPDNQNGAIISWGWGFQRINASGEKLWGEEGISFPDSMGFGSLIPDGQGGAVMMAVYYKYEDSRWSVYSVQRINDQGQFLWGKHGVVYSDSVYYQWGGARISANSDHGCTITFHRKNDGLIPHTQRISGKGEFLFGEEAIPVSPSSGFACTKMVSSNDDSKIYFLVQQDSLQRLFAQKIDSSGSYAWDTPNVYISTIATISDIVTDDRGGAIIAFEGLMLKQVSVNGNLGEVILSNQKDRDQSIPMAYSLIQNYPNPFNPVTTLRYDLPQTAEVSLIVYDLLGREVVRLIDGYMEPGHHEVQWDGRELASGIYIARLRCATPDRPGFVIPGYSKTIKMVLLK